MSWRLPRPSAADEVQPGHQKGSGGKGSGGSDDMRTMIANLQRLSLAAAQRSRELSAATFDTELVPPTFEPAKRAREAAVQYSKEVQKQGKGHKVGSPHIHLADGWMQGGRLWSMCGPAST